jgi:hypothetical protein
MMNIRHGTTYMLAGALAIIALPLILVAAIAGPMLGVIAVTAFVIAWSFSFVFEGIDKSFRVFRIKLVARETGENASLAADLGVPLVETVKAPGRSFEATVLRTEGTCPLLRKKGDTWSIGADGHLSAPLCSPAAAAIQRLLRNEGDLSGSSEHCVCPYGPQSNTYLVSKA